MKLFGDDYSSAFQDEVILFNGVPTPKAYKGSVQIGLKQAFPQAAGNVDAFVNVQFTSLGSLALDTALFAKHVKFMYVFSKYSKF